MKMTMKRSAVLLGVIAMMSLSACSDDNDNDNDTTPTATASASPSPLVTGKAGATQLVHLVCPDPVGETDAYINEEDEDEWSPAYVVDSDTTLTPVAFGEITGTATDGTVLFTEPARTNPDADATGAIECIFEGTFPGFDEAGEPITAYVTGPVTAVVGSEVSSSASASATS